MINYNYNNQEQFFAEELGRIYLRHKQKKQVENLELKKELEKYLAEIDEEKRNKSFFRHFSFLKKIDPKQFLKNIEKNKESDNLATQIKLSHIEYAAPVAAAAAAGIARGAAAGGGRMAAGAEAGAAEGGMLGETSFGNLGGRLSQLQQAGGLEEEEKEEEPKETPDEGETAENLEQVQTAKQAKQAETQTVQKKLQHQRALARMQKITQQVKRIKMALRVAKIGSVFGGLATLGLTLLVTILIWIGQFIGHYLLSIQIIPGFDWLDYLLMAVAAILIAVILLPIIIFMMLLCQLDIFGLIC